tara:strand:+ start:1033 stop:1647 length:615 start_codon:yes stop_codon:yes gene_type:complete
MGYRTISQVAMIVAALFLVFSVTLPQLDSIKVTDAKAKEYEDAVQKTEEYNRTLSERVNTKNSLFKDDKIDILNRYLPFEIDEITVMSDIKFIADNASLGIVGLAVAEVEETKSDVDQYGYDQENQESEPQSKIEYVDFVLSAYGPYESIKGFLSAIEYNQYQIEVVGMSIEQEKLTEDGENVVIDGSQVFSYELQLRVYYFSG